jgi:hypothetical protein
MATIAFESAEIISSGTILRLTFAAGSWSSPTIDLSSVVLSITRDDTPVLAGIIDKRSVVEDTTTVLGDGKLQIDCNCTGNDGTTDSGRNPMHDGMSAVTITCSAGIGTEGSDTTAALSDQAVTLTSLAAGPVFETISDPPPAYTFSRVAKSTGSPTGSLAIKSQATSVPRPGTIVAAADVSGLTIPGISDIYRDLHWEWELTETDSTALVAMAAGTVYDPKYGGNLNLYTDIKGGQFRAPVNFDGTVRLTLTGKYLNTSDEVQTITATQDYTVREIEWGTDVWVDSVNGDSGNDGLDPWGFDISDGAYNPATRELTSAGAFTNYDHAAAVAPEIHRRYNFTYMKGGDFAPSAGTPNDWLKNQTLIDVGAGTDAMNAWANSGTDADWTGTGIDITLQDSSYLVVDATSPDITRASTSNPTSMTVGMAIRTSSSNTRTLLAQSGVFSIRQVSARLWVDIQHGGGTESFDTGVDIGSFGLRKMIVVRFTEGGSNGTLTVRVNGTTALDEVSTTATALLSSSNAMDFQTGGVHDNVEMFLYESAITDAQIEEWEGYWAWSSPFTYSGWQSLLPGGHAYETAGPVYVGPLEIESKTDNDTIVIASGYTLGTTSGITLSDGPLDNCPSRSGNSRFRVASGSVVSDIGGASFDECTVIPYGTSGFTVSSWDNTTLEIGSKSSSTSVFQVGHGYYEGFTAYNAQPVVTWAGNSGVGSYVHSVWFWDTVFIHREQVLLLSTSSPTGDSSYQSGCGIGNSIILASGTLDCEQAFTESSAKDASGNNIQADFGFSYVGFFAENNSANNVLDHIIYSAGKADNRLFACVQSGQSGNSNYVLNLDASENDGVTAIPSRQITVWGCELANTLRGIDLSSQQNTPIEDGGDDNPFAAVQVIDVSGHDLGSQFVLYYICDDVRFAYNHTWRVIDDHYNQGDEDGDLIIHNCYALKETGENGSIVEIPTTLGDSEGSFALFNNYFQDDRTAAEILRAPNSSGSVYDIEGNQVYAPNDSDGEWLYDLDGSAYQSVAEFETATSLSDTFTDASDFEWSGKPDGMAPTVVNRTPADNATGVLESQTISMQFSENMQVGSGTVELRKVSDDSVIDSIAAADATINFGDRTQVTLTGLNATGFTGAAYVYIPSGAFVSSATGTPFAGYTTNTDWNFTVGTTGGNRSRIRNGLRQR